MNTYNEDVWTERYIVGYTMAQYSFHDVFYALFCLFFFVCEFIFFWEGRLQVWRADTMGRGDRWAEMHDVKLTKNQFKV